MTAKWSRARVARGWRRAVRASALGTCLGACFGAGVSIGAMSSETDRANAALVAEAGALERGTAGAPDPIKAAIIYCRAAKAGSVEATVKLGWMYANGRGVPQSDGIAAALFRRANGLETQSKEELARLMSPDTIDLPDCLTGKVSGNKATATAAPATAAPITTTASAPTPAPTRIAVAAPTAAMAAAPAPPAPTPAPTPSTGDSSSAISAAVSAWATAWSSQDINGYLGAYAPSFRPAAGKSRAAWEAERRERVMGKARISVGVEQLQIKVSGNRATARFNQRYQSDKLTQNSGKTLSLVETDGRWLITEEVASDNVVAAR
jgi:ketosteroid isomerase-like protein